MKLFKNGFFWLCVGSALVALSIVSIAFSPPSPQNVCQHLVKLGEVQPRDRNPEDYLDCVAVLQRQPQKVGQEHWKKFARCTMDSTSLRQWQYECGDL